MKKNKRLSEKRFSGNVVLIATFLGGIIGVAVASLTPKTGSILREKIVSAVDFLQTNTAGQKFSGLVQRVNEVMVKSLDYGVKILGDSKKLITDAYKAGKDAFDRTDNMEQASEVIEDDENL